MLKIIKKFYGGRISFNDPILKPAFLVLDGADLLWRGINGRLDLPPFSIRARTNGIQDEFSGRKFVESADKLLARILGFGVDLRDKSILDLGCSCGRLAFALRDLIGAGKYQGIDIDPISIDWAQRYFSKERFSGKFRFDLVSVYSDVYNIRSIVDASTFRFPFEDHQFDIIVAYSLFTHLLANEAENYLRNAYRVMKSGGQLVFSCFAVNNDINGTFLQNSKKTGNTFIYSEAAPRKATAFELVYMESVLRGVGFSRISFDQGVWRTPGNIGGSDQDLFHCIK